jgi:hypothetical protein
VLPDPDRGAVGGEVEVTLAPVVVNLAERQPERSREADYLARLIDRESAVSEIAQRNLGPYGRREVDVSGEGPGQDREIWDMVVTVPWGVDEDGELAPHGPRPVASDTLSCP